MMNVDLRLRPADLASSLERLFRLAAGKLRGLDRAWDPAHGTPVFTVQGQYTTRGWTEWTQGFQYGCALLVFDATDDKVFLKLGRDRVVRNMAPHLTHMGVHDHGFNNLSTYGNLRRLMREKRYPHHAWELAYYELAIQVSGAVQAARWSCVTPPADEPAARGFIHSFNGPHSLFIDTLRTLRVLGLAHQLGHVLMGENDRRISLLERLVTHALTTRRYNVFRGPAGKNPDGGRDHYDLRGRVAHEAIFNPADGRFRCPNSQQGYSPFSTWTRGLAWAILGFAEEVEFLSSLDASEFQAAGLPSKSQVLKKVLEAARDTADFYLTQAAAADGIPYWDTGAPDLHKLGDWANRPADPYNDHEPVDSSAAAIAAQGLLRLGRVLGSSGKRYYQAGLGVARTLFQEPYLATDRRHQGLILHSVYHRPNGWDFIPPGRKVPCGESSMWGDYHALELAVLIQRLAQGGPYPTFFDA